MAGGRVLGIAGIVGRLLIAAFGIAMTMAGVLGIVSWLTGWTFRAKGLALPGDAPGFSLLLGLVGLALLALFQWLDKRFPS